MAYPLKDWLTAKRGYRFGEKTFYSVHHLGVDLIVPEGTPVFAPGNCEIIKTMKGKQGGKTIWVGWTDIKFGKLIMRCLHLSEMSLAGKYGDGEIIGYTGQSGSLCKGAHLHIDISRGKVFIKNFKNFVDPEKYFKKL